jgi:hypothetical protein
MDPRLVQLADYLLSRKNAAEFYPASLRSEVLPLLYILQVEGRDGAVRLRIRLAGRALDDAFGRSVAGHYLDEFIHGPRGRDVLGAFEICAVKHEPVWMRQVVRLRDRLPRFVEGIAVFLEPDRIYGGLVVGELLENVEDGSFEQTSLR